ncbi:MAG: TIGR03564 family F420-dependent LLM class oxidoreductase [Acidimicrobiales bacterium]
MRIGINGSSLIALGSSVTAIGEHAAEAEEHGFATYWVAQLAVPDALTALGVIGGRTSSIELGTAVISTWTRHPLMLAGQALTTQSMCGGRLLLGLGLAHKPSVEGTLRVPFARPAAHMEEYLDVLLPALAGERVDATGATWSGFADPFPRFDGATPPGVMLAAMGPRMLGLAGGRTDGTILWLSGPRTIEEQIRPVLEVAATDAGRPPPRVVASVPVCVTDDPDRVRGVVAEVLAGYNELPSYRQVMDREGAEGPADVSLIGDEATVRAGIERFADAGATDFSALELITTADEAPRTRELLRSLL